MGNDPGLRFVLTPDEADVLVIFPNTDLRAIHEFRFSETGHLLPIVDLTGQFAQDADLSDIPGEAFAWSKVASLAEAFRIRRQALGPLDGSHANPEHRLLAWLAVSEQSLTARYAPGRPDWISFGEFLPIADVETIAEKLANKGLLRRTFFDRFQACPDCSSVRLSVREECVSCRSSEVSDVGILHHYRCGYLGPAEDFHSDRGRLVCPKCAKELRHYGSDHERAGDAVKCMACGHLSGDSAVGFICIDCTARFDASAALTRNVFNYSLSDAGHTALKSPQWFDRENASAPFTTVRADLNLALYELRAQGHDRPFVAELQYCRQAEIEAISGTDGFMRARRHFLDILRSRLSANQQIVSGASNDYLVLPESGDTSAQYAEALIALTAGLLKEDLSVQLMTVDARQFLHQQERSREAERRRRRLEG
jgi:hypothetical protein